MRKTYLNAVIYILFALFIYKVNTINSNSTMPSEARRDEAFILKSFNMQEDINLHPEHCN